MDPNTGHLVKLYADQELPEGYQEIPLSLQVEAKRVLAGRSEAHVDLRSDSPLSQFAADHRRRKAKTKARNRRLRKRRKHKRR